jgi:hypothetical protein
VISSCEHGNEFSVPQEAGNLTSEVHYWLLTLQGRMFMSTSQGPRLTRAQTDQLAFNIPTYVPKFIQNTKVEITKLTATPLIDLSLTT